LQYSPGTENYFPALSWKKGKEKEEEKGLKLHKNQPKLVLKK
jgi:hypothetical protein